MTDAWTRYQAHRLLEHDNPTLVDDPAHVVETERLHREVMLEMSEDPHYERGARTKGDCMAEHQARYDNDEGDIY